MADKEGCSWGDTRDQDTRAASPLIRIILLFALVMMGAMLISSLARRCSTRFSHKHTQNKPSKH